ncbi:MAG: NUDIX domain-containing protein [Acetobacter sp.]|nr:NUDIX domain-containing protein [Acetobacter sp.]MBQ5469533.1 NUDIX domain-containing protein [Acetobacter sp.]MBQ5479272.1 NUDIX domain-containing protein [Acetobacter sp.]MBQ5546722.1 NUDIX domain-containing protein [Acetobacter sp.]MBQ5773506.1 NUDIX domain-containing protein [Acetobacter sp.]
MPLENDFSPFFRHLQHCNTAALSSQRAPFLLADQLAGWVNPALFTRLEHEKLGTHTTGFHLPFPQQQLEILGETLAQEGFYTSHHELFDVIPNMGKPAVGRIDRGALPLFGFVASGVHMNGLVYRDHKLHLWIGKRSAHKRLDPSKLDNLVAGGVPAGFSPREALAKEAEEEANIPSTLIAQAIEVGRIVYALDRPEGLRRDILYCYDLFLPETFIPSAIDCEVDSFELLPIEDVFSLVQTTEAFKFNVNLVLIDLFLRLKLIDPTSTEGQRLRQGLNEGLSPISPRK